MLNLVHELIRAGKWEEARSLCVELLAKSPLDPALWAQRGFLESAGNQLEAAEHSLRKAIDVDPTNALVFDKLSEVLQDLGRASEAEGYSRQAVTLLPANSQCWLNLGNAIFAQRRWLEAADIFRKLLSIDPEHAAAWCNLAACEHKLGNLEVAEAAYERSLAIAPHSSDTVTNHARLLADTGRTQQAFEIVRDLLNREPDSAPAWLIAANGLREFGHFAEAEDAYRNALRCEPNHAEANHNLAVTLHVQGKLAAAEAQILSAFKNEPDSWERWLLFGHILQAQTRTEEGVAAVQRAVSLGPTAVGHSQALAAMQYGNEVTPHELLDAHRAWAMRHCAAIELLRLPACGGQQADRPLRLGFLSADFRRHPIAFLALPLLEQLRAQGIALTCYSDSPATDEYTARFRAASSSWRDIFGFTDQQVADQIRSDNVDVLFDLMGHNGRRMLVFAHRPAAVQITWLGYVGTTGLEAMDYLLADRFHVAPGEEQNYVEQVLRMPNGYVCYASPSGLPNVAPLPALKNGDVTFGSLNNPVKFSPRTIDLWSQVLGAVPRSRLLLKFKGLDDPIVIAHLCRQFAQCGVESHRLDFAGQSKQADFLSAYQHIDISLDTQPYSGGATTCESLWMGVPVITFPGKTFAGRHATSHLTNAGYPQFVAKDAAEYVGLAIHWSNRLDELAAMRANMREQMQRSPLCDARQFAHDFVRVIEQACQMQAGRAAR